MKRINREKARAAIAERKPFKISSGSFWGRWEDEFTYVVFSYRTPIAWFDAPGNAWTTDQGKYSATTSRHQGIVRRAIA